ncbi:MAG: serine hydrolase [Mesorhizobium sp.]|uniref:serine hydrolase domain-containing protein n=2 Tax=Mesorhizobium sp. TaxID=1871066 RepID=UPI00122447D2|nr:serine hydrolase [Mesorhizobium sp.]TIL19212.1 MAG: serine hydrolase [Mesorhizobium sp.]TIQ35382.1 MAG: serine hydrolase [Mesorhizobium sp.]TIW59449.1 MAG: serine hydrolase [Mesorhizobium sp.]TIW66827.1 MAG: serine hydrolase [Mesorhizobium sp.]TJW30985.1 MAG: serine hydrolase [Mesorhizobium sp.]
MTLSEHKKNIASRQSTSVEGTLEFEGRTYLDGLASDPRTLGWMQGFPPPTNKHITFEGGRYMNFPEIRWSLSHMRELVPTVSVARSDEAGVPLNEPSPADKAAVEALAFTDMNGTSRRLDKALFDTYTDGIMVLHRGSVVFERFFGALERNMPHACFSVTKSYAGTLAAALVHEGVLDERKLISHYLPELRGTAWEDATLRQVMDMQTGLEYSEDEVDEQSSNAIYMRACRTRSRPANYCGPQTSCDFLRTVRKEGEHGEVFSYKSVNTQVMAWVMSRVTGRSFAQLLHERLWAPLGCEDDGYLVVDPAGMSSASGGLYASLRDFARFGELIRREGERNGKQILPASVVADIWFGGDPARFTEKAMPGYSYRNQWWVSHNELGAIEAMGIHGQRLYVAPKAEMVIAKFASHPLASSAISDVIIVPLMLELGRLLGG